MGKIEADGLKKISVSALKEYGYLSGVFRSGTFTWTSHYGNESSVGVSVWTTDKPLLRLVYSSTNRNTGEKKDHMYDIPLTTTPCQYGSRRYWFICPMSRNGNYCGRRVGTLYLGDALFACRHCYDLTYASRNASERYKGFVSVPDIERAEKKVKRYYYRGKPTRKYRRVLKLNERFEYGLLRMAGKLL